MKIQHRISNPSGIGRSGQSRAERSTLCSCGEARARRRKTVAKREDQSDQPQFKIPEPLRIDRNDLCAALERAIPSGGKIGHAAKKLLKVLHPHLLKEEEGWLQTLGLLVPLAQGQISAEMRIVPLKTEHLKSRMFEIMREHIAIIEASRNLARAARADGRLKLAAFTERLMLRVWTDEVVFYPAAILIGEYLKLRFAERNQSLKV